MNRNSQGMPPPWPSSAVDQSKYTSTHTHTHRRDGNRGTDTDLGNRGFCHSHTWGVQCLRGVRAAPGPSGGYDGWERPPTQLSVAHHHYYSGVRETDPMTTGYSEPVHPCPAACAHRQIPLSGSVQDKSQLRKGKARGGCQKVCGVKK